MKKRLFVLPLLLVLLGFGLSGCGSKEAIEDDNQFDVALLQKGIWTLDKVDVNTFDSYGTLTSSEEFDFGPDTPGGICTFNYGTDEVWTMNDNGDLFTARYSLSDRIIYTEGGGTWGLRILNEDNLEMVLRGDESLNPCQYTVSGAVYTLTRNSK